MTREKLTTRLESPDDMCVCGDSRKWHVDGVGPCRLDDGDHSGHWGHFGAGPCKRFTPEGITLAKEPGNG
jgi:hypothetical protein